MLVSLQIQRVAEENRLTTHCRPIRVPKRKRTNLG